MSSLLPQNATDKDNENVNLTTTTTTSTSTTTTTTTTTTNDNNNNNNRNSVFNLPYGNGSSNDEDDDEEEWVPESPQKKNTDNNNVKNNNNNSNSGSDDDDDDDSDSFDEDDDDEDYVPPDVVGATLDNDENNLDGAAIVMEKGGGKKIDKNNNNNNANEPEDQANTDPFSALYATTINLVLDKNGEEIEDEEDEEEDIDNAIAKRTRTKNPLAAVEEDTFFDQLVRDLPQEEEDFDFGIVDEDEEYERFKSFLIDPELFDESAVLSESESSDDDDYAPEKDQDHDGESDDDADDEKDENRTVSNKEWRELINDVRDCFENDLSDLNAITAPSQHVTNKERRRQEQMSTEEGRRYLEKLTSNTRSYLHLVIQSFLKCRYQMDHSPRSITYRDVMMYNQLYDHLLELDKMYHGRLISNNVETGGSKRRTLLRKHVREQRKKASRRISLEKKRAKVLAVPGLHLIPELLRLCPKSTKAEMLAAMNGSSSPSRSSKKKKKSSSSSKSSNPKPKSKLPLIDEAPKYLSMDDRGGKKACVFVLSSPEIIKTRKKEILAWLSKYKPFEVYGFPLRFRSKIDAIDNELLLLNVTSDNINGNSQDTKLNKRADKYPVVDTYQPAGQKRIRRQRAFTAWEDDLLFLGLKKYTHTDFESIQKEFLPGFTKNGIKKYFMDIVQTKPKTKSLISTKSKIRDWYTGKKKAHESWSPEETISLQKVFYYYLYGNAAQKAKSVDYYVGVFQQTHPQRTNKSIKNKFNRVKNNIPKNLNDIGKDTKQRPEVGSISSSSSSSLSSINNPLNQLQNNNQNPKILKKKRKTKGQRTTVDRRESLREFENQEFATEFENNERNKNMEGGSLSGFNNLNVFINDNNPSSNVFARSFSQTLNPILSQNVENGISPKWGNSLSQDLFVSRSEIDSLDGIMRVNSQTTSDISMSPFNPLSRKNSIEPRRSNSLLGNSNSLTGINNELNRSNSLVGGGINLQTSLPGGRSFSSQNGASLNRFPTSSSLISPSPINGPTTFAGFSSNSNNVWQGDEGGELGFDNGGQLDGDNIDDGNNNNNLSNNVNKRKSNDDEITNNNINNKRLRSDSIDIANVLPDNSTGLTILNNIMSLNNNNSNNNNSQQAHDSNSNISIASNISSTNSANSSEQSSTENESLKFFVRRSNP